VTADESTSSGLSSARKAQPRPPTPWAVEGDSTALVERWNRLRPRVYDTLSRASTAALHQECEHPSLGKMTGWEMLQLMDRHTAEHVGHVELTRDLARAAGV